tara:strand:+ start:44498 stop:46222 length:1725 start_codon:yes stop_codon:yes gene_type:complete
MSKSTVAVILFACLAFHSVAASQEATETQPNVLLISIDDLNDWVGCMGGHPQAHTPNIDRLASGGVLFTNAHCAAPACNPSRTAIMTGISPHVSGLYENGQKMREVLPDSELIPKYFSRHGYWSAGSGKILHYFIDAASWDEYFPKKESENPFPRTMYPQERPVSLPRGGPWQYVETDWAPLDASDEEYGGDWLVTDWIGRHLRKEHDKPFFLACGIYRPHEPWFVPKHYFDMFPLSDIQLPPGYRDDDLDDLPPEGRRRGPNRYFAHIQAQDQWRNAIQGYLASIAFADAMVGRVVDALEAGPNATNTIVVLYSDHGWHLGEKEHWQKYTAWRVCTRVPLIIRVPKDAPGLHGGTRPQTVCDQPVNLVSLYPTLTQLAGLPNKDSCDGPSLVPLLENENAKWPHVSTTFLSKPGNVGISGPRWRYIRYADGGEELYDTETDRYEWNNLADRPAHRAQLVRMQQHVPEQFAKYIPPSDAALTQLDWHPSREIAPASKPDGSQLNVIFLNERKETVKLFWIDRKGTAKSYGTIDSGTRKSMQSRPGAVWMIADSDDSPLGHFIVGDRTARAVIRQ